MSILQLFSFIYKELKTQKLLYTLFFIILLIMYSITISTFSTAIYIPQKYKSDIQMNYPEGVSISAKGNINELVSIVYDKVDFLNINNHKLLENIVISNDLMQHSNSIGLAYKFTDYNLVDYQMIQGDFWSSQSNGSFDIWISEYISDYLGALIGQEIIFTTFSDISFSFIIRGIYKTDSGTDFLISVKTLLLLSSIDLDGNAVIGVKNVLKIRDIASILSSEGFDYLDFTGMVDMIEAITASEILFWSLTVILFFVSAFMMNTFLLMIVNSREKTYGLYKALGLNSSTILTIVFSVLILIIIMSILFGIWGSKLINLHYRELIYSLFEFEVEIAILWYIPIIVFVFSIVLVVSCLIRYKSKISKTTATLIMSEEN